MNNWSSLYYLINELSINLNVYFIIMSATLPDFDSLKLDKNSNIKYNSVQLIKNHEKYFNHSLFKRTEIVSQIKELDTKDPSIFHDYFEEIISSNFKIGFNKGLIVLNTIKTSKFVFDHISTLKNKYNFKTELLNSTIIPSERKKIINRINEMNGIKYILISTQSIEAGVDVSFDFVVRDFSVLDSIEQVRGRCNRSRELNKRFKDENIKGNVYIVNIKRNGQDEYDYIYNNEEIKNRIKETREIFKKNHNYNYNDVLNYYNNVSKNINTSSDDKEKNFIFKDLDNIDYWQKLQFSEILNQEYGIHIINKKRNERFFVSTNMDINIKNNKFDLTQMKSTYTNNPDEFIFSFSEINYIQNCEKDYGIRIIEKNRVTGSNLIKLYREIYEDFKKNYPKKKIIQKEFSSILYKFIFHVSDKDIENLIASEKLETLGYFFVIPENKIGNKNTDIYSLKNGFNFNYEVEEYGHEIY